MGVPVGPHRLLNVAWADDTWLTARSPAELGVMMRELNDAAAKVGILLGLPTCRRAEVRRLDRTAQPATEEYAELREMATVATTSTMRMLGAEVNAQPDQ